jgi:hypothetical protein
MDAGSRQPAGRSYRHEVAADLSRAIEQVRTTPPPVDSLAQAIERVRCPDVLIPSWLRGLLRGVAAPN